MKAQHTLTRRLLALTFLLLICAMLFTSCSARTNQSIETSAPTETSKPTDDSKPTDNNQTEPHVHAWSDWAVTTEPTCTEKGEESRSCSCGEVEKQAIDSIGHSFGEWQTTTEPTCTEKGEQKRECACGESEIQELDAKGHNYTSVVTDPTCTAKGYTTHTCSCGDSYVDKYVDALGHSFGEWKTTKEATCESKGEQKRECSCGEVETKSISAIGHSYSAVITKPACTDRGYTTYTCTCGDSYVDNYVNATGHTFGAWEITKEATCTENGEQKRMCACGEIETEDIPASGHNYKAVVTAPSCEEKGYTTHTCLCGNSYVDNYVNETGHSFGVWKTTKEATCTENGEQKRECACSKFETKSIVAKGHDYTSIVTNPTCTEQGYTTHTCACGHSYTDNYVNSNGHTELIDKAVASTCTETGLTEGKHCFVCGKILIAQKVIEATGHSVVIVNAVPPTCIEVGSTEGSYCSTCGKVLVEPTYVPTKDHTPKAAEAKHPTCTESGFTSGVICSYCSYTIEGVTKAEPLGHNYVNLICTRCQDELEPSEGLIFKSNNDGTCYVSGSGTLDSPYLLIPSVSPNGDTVTAIGKYALEYLDIKMVVIPDSVKEIRYGAFMGCTNLTNVTVPNSVTKIDHEAFRDCDSLTIVFIPESVTFIGEEVFDDCDNLASVVLDENNTEYFSLDGIIYSKEPNYYGGYVVAVPQKIQGNVTLWDGLTFIEYGMFANCAGLTGITIPNSVTTIEAYAFSECTGLTSIMIPNSVTAIYYDAFYGCTSLKSITIPDSVTEIGSGAFGGCTSLESITLPFIGGGKTSHEEALFGYIFGNYESSESIKIEQLDIAYSKYKYYIPKALKSVTITGGNIYFGAFSGCSGLTNITLPQNATVIQDWAFSDCVGLTNIVIPKGVKKIGYSAFSGCSGLKSIVLPDGVTMIDEYAFDWCTSLSSIVIPNSVNSIGEAAFRSCESLTSIIFKGTIAEWNAITFDDYWRHNVPATEVICSNGTVSLT
ncbi:MAG: leucine-rich repeat domain-containing protein [Clostridia bacterium]|nr:leucine-rich repeat domain-containing protein [Clostridia bacterium]